MYDLNDVEPQRAGELIPDGTFAKVTMTIRPGGVDGYPGDVDGEGDPVALAEARTRTFSRRKVLMVSTPTIHGLSRIEREFETSDQRRYFVPCPSCGHMQWLRFERLRWEKGAPETVAYHCEACEAPIPEHRKTWMLENGAWRPTAEGDPRTAGFHLSSLYSPLGWRSWAEIAAAWEAAQGSEAALKSFKNTELGETWQERGEAPDWRRLYDRREAWRLGTVPMGGLVLTAGADVQRDRIEVDVWAWGRGLESWLVDHLVLEGDPGRREVWDALSSILSRTWPHAGGAELGIARLAIDTGGEHTAAVYAWARRQGAGLVMPVKGVGGFARSAPVSGPTYVDATEGGRRIRRGARLWTVAVSVFKSETYRWLRLDAPTDEDLAAGARYPEGYVHLPKGVDAEWIKQLVAEQLVTVRNRRGYARLEWQKLRERNEALDCRVYARAAAWLVGVDRWSERKWRDLERQLGVDDAKEDQSAGAGRPAETRRREAHHREPSSPVPSRYRQGSWLDDRRRGWLRRR